MIWSVSTLSPRTNALPSMMACMLSKLGEQSKTAGVRLVYGLTAFPPTCQNALARMLCFCQAGVDDADLALRLSRRAPPGPRQWQSAGPSVGGAGARGPPCPRRDLALPPTVAS